MSSMDSDEVNSISDTTESQQVVAIIKTVYDDILSRGDLAVYKTLFNLDASTDALKPVIMTKPQIIDNIYWLKYNRVRFGDTDPVWTELVYRPVDEFLFMVQQMNPSETTVDTFTLTTPDGFSLIVNYRNDIGPSWYTSFDDTTIVFDAVDKAVDSTLQTSKIIGYGSKTTAFTETDGFVPALQPHQFALLLNEAKSLAWTELKQTQHPKAEQTARRNWRHLAKTRQHIPNIARVDKGSRFDSLDAFPNFSRR
jgi:hypothetical protein